jgi:hypothetical protein
LPNARCVRTREANASHDLEWLFLREPTDHVTACSPQSLDARRSTPVTIFTRSGSVGCPFVIHVWEGELSPAAGSALACPRFPSHLPVCCEPHDLRPESDITTLKGAGLGSRSRWLHGATSYAPSSYILAQYLVQSWILLLKRETPKTVPPLWSPVPPAERPWQCWNISGKNASKS